MKKEFEDLFEEFSSFKNSMQTLQNYYEVRKKEKQEQFEWQKEYENNLKILNEKMNYKYLSDETGYMYGGVDDDIYLYLIAIMGHLSKQPEIFSIANTNAVQLEYEKDGQYLEYEIRPDCADYYYEIDGEEREGSIYLSEFVSHYNKYINKIDNLKTLKESDYDKK